MFKAAQEEGDESELDREPIYKPVQYKFPPEQDASGNVQ